MAMKLSERVQEFIDLEDWFAQVSLYMTVVNNSDHGMYRNYSEVKELVTKINRYVELGESLTPDEENELVAWGNEEPEDNTENLDEEKDDDDY